MNFQPTIWKLFLSLVIIWVLFLQSFVDVIPPGVSMTWWQALSQGVVAALIVYIIWSLIQKNKINK